MSVALVGMKTGTTLFGYRVLAKIGQGAASELYAVQDPKTKQVWALKHVVKRTEKDQRFLDQVEQEHFIGSKLSHPNIRSTHRLIRHRKLFKVTDIALLMELVDAEPVDARPPRSQRQAVEMFIQTARGLAHMHSGCRASPRKDNRSLRCLGSPASASRSRPWPPRATSAGSPSSALTLCRSCPQGLSRRLGNLEPDGSQGIGER